MPRVRICAGGAGQPASLPRPGRNRPRDYKRAVVVDLEPTKANKTTPGSGRRSLFKKDLTGPTLSRCPIMR
jgi:hypothetical protein